VRFVSRAFFLETLQKHASQASRMATCLAPEVRLEIGISSSGPHMLDFNNITFLVFFVLILGQAITAFRGTTLQGRFHPYWPLSLCMFAAYYLYFGLDPLWPKGGYSIANFFLFSGSLAQALLFKEWNGTSPKRAHALLWGLTLAACLIFELLIRHGTYVQRVLWTMSVLIAIAVWRLIELIRLHRREPLFTVKLMLFFVVCYLIFCGLRLATVTFHTAFSLYSEGAWGFATRSLGSTLTVLMHIAIAGHYAEKFWASEREALQLQVDGLRTIAQLENTVEKTEASNEALSKLISERDHMLMINSRFSTVSSLAMFNSAIVHELSQPLAALALTLEEAKWHLKDADPAQMAPIEQSMALVQKIGQMNQSLRNLMMAQKPDYVPVDLTACIQDMLPILQNESHRRSVQLTACIEPPELVVHAHKVMFERIIFNLVANAMDALAAPSAQPDQPKITLQLAQQMHRDRPHAVLTVSDNGPGFESHLLAQEWMHFQSTKATGMGVGLILCHYIVSTWSGEMLLDNLPSGGACVRLWIPLQTA
jgi:signal transduction histidine kinase